MRPGEGKVEKLDDAHCLLRTQGDSLEWLAFMLMWFDVDFEVHEPPELVDHLAGIAVRLGRAAGQSIGVTLSHIEGTGTLLSSGGVGEGPPVPSNLCLSPVARKQGRDGYPVVTQAALRIETPGEGGGTVTNCSPQAMRVRPRRSLHGRHLHGASMLRLAASISVWRACTYANIIALMR